MRPYGNCSKQKSGHYHSCFGYPWEPCGQGKSCSKPIKAARRRMKKTARQAAKKSLNQILSIV